jgi:uncharacterized protein
MVKTNDMKLLVELVSSRVKAEIFRLLFGDRQQEIHLREIVRQSKLSLGTVQQELSRLTRLGLVIPRKDGNRVYYRANSAHPVFSELHGLVLKTSGLVGILSSALQSDEIAVAFIFGSVAKGEATPASDIDLIVIGSLGLRSVVRLLSGVSEQVGREINPHVFSPDEFRERKHADDHFLTSVLHTPKLFVKGGEHELGAMG